MEAPEINFKIELNGFDATKDLTPYLTNFTYVDNLKEKADELIVEVDNSDMRFLNGWFFSPGMVVKAWIGNMFCGRFMIDEPSESGGTGGHTAEFRAQSAEFNGPIRTKRSFAHSDKSLRDIVKKYADDHKLKVVGQIPDLNLKTIIQYRISDIDFLHNLARDYGCICSVKGGNLVFETLDNIWKNKAVKTIDFSDVINYKFGTSLADASDAATLAWDDPHGGETKGAIVVSDDLGETSMVLDHSRGFSPAYKNLIVEKYKDEVPGGKLYTTMDEDYNVPSQIVTIFHEKAESQEEAKVKAKGRLQRHRNLKHKGMFTLPGNEYLVSGNGISVTGFGKRSGYWLIETSSHRISYSGAYTTSLDMSHGAATTGNKSPVDTKQLPNLNAGGVPSIPDASVFDARF